MDIRLSYTQENDLKKVLFTLAQIKTGFYQKNNFMLFIDSLPQKFVSSKNVLLNKPLFDYLSTEFDWEKLDESYYGDLANQIKDKNYFQEFKPHLNEIENHKIDLNLLKNAARTILEFHEVSNCDIQIYLVSTGTPVSFRFVDKSIKIFARFDTSHSQIIPGISNAIVSKIYPADYVKRQGINKFLFLNTKLKHLIDLKIYKQMYLENDTFNLQSNSISEENYRVLGFPLSQLIYINNYGQLESEHINLEELTNKEYLILQKLVESQGSVVSFEDLSMQLWGNIIDKKFSLEAISKIIERLRIKLKNEGINREVIFTKRGRGYIFIN